MVLLLSLACCMAINGQRQRNNIKATSPQHEDTELLGRALDYFVSGKYHEALILFQPLDKSYRLNARFRAYIGLCYYYDWDYKNAVTYLDEVIPQLSPLSPQERSIYYYANAESHFFMQQYPEAISNYEGVLLNGLERDKGDALYRLGLCYYLLGEEAATIHDTLVINSQRTNALEYLEAAATYYHTYRNTADLAARLTQIEKMCNGLNAYLRQQNTKEEDPSPSE